MDVSPKQVVSVAAALIPFLENDDANRALMGSNMQRQAVPLIQTDAPLVGTGMEDVVARDSGAVVVARRPGVVEQIDGTRIVIRATEETDATKPGVDIYRLSKFQRSNQNTCINQRPLVRVGDRIAAGDIIADGPSTDLGELALGRNALVAFMPWNGYNFEELHPHQSERIVRDDVFTSIHIEEFEVMARDTKLGPEEITRDIPNVGEEALRNLDEAGIVAIGAEVLPGDILVGKVTPKGEVADDAGGEAPARHLRREGLGRARHLASPAARRRRHGGRGAGVQPARRREGRAGDGHRAGGDRPSRQGPRRRVRHPEPQHDRPPPRTADRHATPSRVRKGLGRGEITPEKLEEIAPGLWWQIAVDDEKAMGELEAMRRLFDDARKRLDRRFEDKVDKLQRGDELPPGVMKMVKVFVAVKRKLQPGDKMAGRHGNKGVISQHPADRGHAAPGGRHLGGRGAQSAGRALADERRPDLRDPPGLGLRGPGQADRGYVRGLADRAVSAWP